MCEQLGKLLFLGSGAALDRKFEIDLMHILPDAALGEKQLFRNLAVRQALRRSADAETCLSGVRQPFSSVRGRKRYNTLDFASKIVCQQGCSHPYWKPGAKGFHPAAAHRIDYRNQEKIK